MFIMSKVVSMLFSIKDVLRDLLQITPSSSDFSLALRVGIRSYTKRFSRSTKSVRVFPGKAHLPISYIHFQSENGELLSSR